MLHAESLELRRLTSDLTVIYRIDFSAFLRYVTPVAYSWESDEINETV